jgi:hypothetical protein
MRLSVVFNTAEGMVHPAKPSTLCNHLRVLHW